MYICRSEARGERELVCSCKHELLKRNETTFVSRNTIPRYLSEIKRGSSTCTVDDPLAKARGLSPYMLTNHALSLTMHTGSILCSYFSLGISSENVK